MHIVCPPCYVQTGWTGLKSFYATVASTVEAAAKTQGYTLDLGSKAVASSSSNGGGGSMRGPRSYPDTQPEPPGGYDYMQEEEPQGYGGRPAGQPGREDYGGGGHEGGGVGGRANGGGGGGNNGFSGFDGGADNGAYLLRPASMSLHVCVLSDVSVP